MRAYRHSLAIALTLALLAGWRLVDAYSFICCPRQGTSATYYVNPANGDGLSSTTVLEELAAAYALWATDATTANYVMTYAGATTGTATVQNGKNEVMFSPTSDGSLYGGTWWWGSTDGKISETDTVFYDAGVHFFTGAAGCTGSPAMYLADAAAHEIGHQYGMGHSADTTATMYPTTAWCATRNRTLTTDDIGGIMALYKPVGTATAPAAPSNLRVTAAATTSLALAWQDNSSDETAFRIERSADGLTFAEIATVGAGTATYTAGGLTASTTYSFRVRASNTSGTSGYSNITAGTTTAPAQPLTLTLVATKVVTGSGQSVSLEWRNSTMRVDIYRNYALLVTTKLGALSYRDKVGSRTAPFTGSLSYQVCQSTTTTCSNTAAVTF